VLEIASLSSLPRVPSVYALYGGDEPREWVAYVGLAGNLRTRLNQHLVRRDSSVTTGTTAVGLNIEHVRRAVWWEHPRFADEAMRHAAELVAFDVLDPALRSRGNPSAAALKLYESERFRAEMELLFRGTPSGRLVIPSIETLLRRVAELERRLLILEERET
jgi:hypothetical protein